MHSDKYFDYIPESNFMCFIPQNAYVDWSEISNMLCNLAKI